MSAAKTDTKGTTKSGPIQEAFNSSRGQKMAPHELSWMLAYIVRIPAVTMLAMSRVEASQFNSAEAHLVLFWRGVEDAIKSNNGALPPNPLEARELVSLKCSAIAATDPNVLYYTPAVQHAVFDGESGLIDETFRLPISDALTNTAIDLLARFLRERTLSDVIQRALSGYGVYDTITNPEAVLTAIEDTARGLIGMEMDPGSQAIIEGFVPVGRKSVTTKTKFLDRIMGGGHADQECYALLGPSSGGKSVLGVQIAMEAAELEAATASELGETKARYWYYFTWELTEAQLRTRIYSYGARIDIGSFNDLAKHGTPYSTSRKPESLKPYETEPYVNSPGNPVMGEVERLQALERRRVGIGANLKIVDYSSDRPGHGDNFIDGVAGYLKTEVARGFEIGGIVIDYAKLAVDRYISAQRLRPDMEYKLLSRCGSEVRSKVSIPFKCKSWVLHQLHGAAAKKRFGKLHYSDALGCKNFADNFDFGIEFGMYNEDSGLVEFSSSKHRHAAGLNDGVVAKFEGRFGVFLDPDQDYARDPATGQLVPRDFIDRMPVTRQPGYRPNKVIDPNEGID